MEASKYSAKTKKLALFWLTLSAVFFVLDFWGPKGIRLPSDLTLYSLIGMITLICGLAEIFTLGTQMVFARQKRPAIEGVMVGRLYRLAAILAILLGTIYGLGRLEQLGTSLAAFGGMLLGWSLQAPVSGFAAWMLVSLKRPFRPGDRIQFPSLGLTGDVQDIGAMYTVLDQVGGSIGSEEAVGRFVLVPNAMLFSQVVINYTVKQEAAYMLDEVVVRITYDSDWKEAEKILLDAAAQVTGNIIQATSVKPYIRSDLYDYGVYLRLRYQTSVQNRTQIASEINKRIFTQIQSTPSVDIAIPFIYSYRAGADRKENEAPHDKDVAEIEAIDISHVREAVAPFDPKEIEVLSQSISKQGLLQPIVVVKDPQNGVYEIVAGDKRFAACKHLGWKTIPAVVRGAEAEAEVK